MAKRPDPHRAIADAVKAKKDSDGMVQVYPTEPLGENSVPNVAAAPQKLTPSEAADLLGYMPPAFTLYESGKPMPEQKHMAEIAAENAWGMSDPDDEPPKPNSVTQAPDERAAAKEA